jgi:hypothetical protein
MGVACCTHENDVTCIKRIYLEKLKGRYHLERPRRRRGDNVRTHVKEIGWEVVG